MSSVAAGPGLRERVSAPPARLAAALAVLVLVGISAVLRTRAIDAPFWIDEGISVGIASYSFWDIPSVLQVDGSPPLYYLLLHLWMQAFGVTETATHALSLVFALLSIPIALWAAGSVFGRRVGWIAAGLATLNPFITYYAQETRMYAIAVVLSMLLAATFIHAFVDRRPRFAWAFGVVLAAMLYTHNWAIFLGGGTVVAFALLWRWSAPEDRRALLGLGLRGYGIAALLYLPWVPTLIHQALYTGAPWAERPGVVDLLYGLRFIFGGATAGLVVLLIAGNGIAALVRGRRDDRVAALLVLTASAVVLAWLASQLSPAFANRYFASFVGPTLILAAVGLGAAGRLGLVTLAVLAVLWFDPRVGALTHKSNVRSVSASIQALVTPGDLVVSTHPEQLPLVSYYLPRGVRYANSLGPVADPRVFDWTNCVERLQNAKPTPTINRLVRTLQPGQELVLVQPLLRSAGWEAPWTSLVRRRSGQWERRLDADPRMRREAVVPVFGYDPIPRGVRAVVYRVRRPGETR